MQSPTSPPRRAHSRLCWYALCWLSGLAFWLPGMLLHAIRGRQFGASPLDIVLMTVLPLATVFAAMQILSTRRPEGLSRYSTALWMLLGIWMLGPLCTMIGASFSGGGFLQPDTWWFVLIGTFTVVPLTFIASTYNGTLASLAIITLALIVDAIISFAKRKRDPLAGEQPS